MTAERIAPAGIVLALLVLALLVLAGGESVAVEGTARRAQARTPAQTGTTSETPIPPPRPAGLPGAPATGAAQPPAAPPAAPASSVAPAQANPPANDGACLDALRAVYGDKIDAVPPSKPLPADPQCRVVDPVIVAAMSFEGGTIGFAPPVTLSCAMAGKVALWLKTSVRPLTRGYLGGELAKLQVGGGQECRRRNRAATGPVSEHATGRALDIFAFEVAAQNPMRIVVEKPDAPIQRDYLLALRQSACGAFNTSLGPGSDPAHVNHIHVDIQARRSDASKFCQ